MRVSNQKQAITCSILLPLFLLGILLVGCQQQLETIPAQPLVSSMPNKSSPAVSSRATKSTPDLGSTINEPIQPVVSSTSNLSVPEVSTTATDWKIDYSKFLPENGMSIKAFSPVDLVITDPDNLTISKELNEIPGAIYVEIHLDKNGTLDDLIEISERKIGEYTIEVIPEPGANPTDTYNIEVSTTVPTFGHVSVILADNVTIEATPTEPYIFHSMIRQNTRLSYTGEISGVNTASINLSAVFVDENGVPLPDKTIIFDIGLQSTTSVTDEYGLASTTLILEQEPGIYYFVDASFAGDEYYMPAFEYKQFEIKILAAADIVESSPRK